MTDTGTPTPSEAKHRADEFGRSNPGGDMTDGVARAHLETPEEIAATATDIEVDTNRQVIAAPAPSTARSAVENALLEDVATGDLSSPLPEERITLANAYKFQHAKVLRFEVSVGKDDDSTSIEDYQRLVITALNFAVEHGQSVFTDPADVLRINNLTLQGGYYIIDGKVCLPADYDPATKNRKPDTYPPSWAGGPSPSDKPLYGAQTATASRPTQSSRITERLTKAQDKPTGPIEGTRAAEAEATRPKVQGTPESVRALAENINLKIRGKK